MSGFWSLRPLAADYRLLAQQPDSEKPAAKRGTTLNVEPLNRLTPKPETLVELINDTNVQGRKK